MEGWRCCAGGEWCGFFVMLSMSVLVGQKKDFEDFLFEDFFLKILFFFEDFFF